MNTEIKDRILKKNLLLADKSSVAYFHETNTISGSFRNALHSALDTYVSEIIHPNTEQDNWISVNDKLPEVNVNVLLYTGMNKPEDIMIGSLNENGWFWDEEANYMSIPVTHWMPLPNKPKNI